MTNHDGSSIDNSVMDWPQSHRAVLETKERSVLVDQNKGANLIFDQRALYEKVKFKNARKGLLNND